MVATQRAEISHYLWEGAISDNLLEYINIVDLDNEVFLMSYCVVMSMAVVLNDIWLTISSVH